MQWVQALDQSLNQQRLHDKICPVLNWKNTCQSGGIVIGKASSSVVESLTWRYTMSAMIFDLVR